jgi:hypothetical protein
MITVAVTWRDTPGPTWQLVAVMLRNQRWELEERRRVQGAYHENDLERLRGNKP